jgi:hypothetical protein
LLVAAVAGTVLVQHGNRVAPLRNPDMMVLLVGEVMLHHVPVA